MASNCAKGRCTAVTIYHLKAFSFVKTRPAGYGFNMYAPGKVYSDRVNIVDVRFGKILNYKGMRTNLAVDLLNLFNTNTATGFQQNFGATFRTPSKSAST